MYTRLGFSVRVSRVYSLCLGLYRCRVRIIIRVRVGLGLGRQSCTHDWDLVLGSVVYIAFAKKISINR